jgi:hypothetical protein
MNRAGWLQARRMKTFRDVRGRREAGELPGMSERQFRRYGGHQSRSPTWCRMTS